MHLILRHTGDTDPVEIEITGSVFAIGRHEPPFVDYDRKKVARLSKRHARIFEQAGRVFLADLGSTNGTFCEGERVLQEPRLVQNGARLSFGGLEYEVEMPGRTPQPTAEDEGLTLALTPETHRDVLEPLVISSFPFLINQYGEEFARYRETLAEPLSYISRRHAHFFVRDGTVLIEDLGSTNGTYVSGTRLEERARTLEDGDTVAFGGDQFLYRVHIIGAESADETTTLLTEAIEELDSERTIFIDSPTSFVDIYVGTPEGESDAPKNTDVSDGDGIDEVPAKKPSRIGRAARFARELVRVVFGERLISPRARWILILGSVMAIAGAAYWYRTGQETRELTDTFAAGDHEAVLADADGYLTRQPGSQAIRAIATESMMHLVLPVWLHAIDRAAFDEALTQIEQWATRSPHNPDDDAMFELLDWITRATGFVDQHNSERGLNQRFEDGLVIDELADWWRAEERNHERHLQRFAAWHPDYREVERRALTTWRRLQTIDAAQAPVRRLHETIMTALRSQDLTSVTDGIDAFSTNPAGSGLASSLHQDVARMRQIFELLEDDRPFSAHEALGTALWETRPFQEFAAELVANQLPDQNAIAKYQTAVLAWQSGDTEAARAGLNDLARSSRWGAEPAKLQAHHDDLLNRYRALSGRELRDSPSELLTFYRMLDPETDRFLIDALDESYQSVFEDALVEAEAELLRAGKAWQRYQDQGGISRDDRMEPSISDRYVQLAALLTDSHTALLQAKVAFRALETSAGNELATLETRVCAEIDNQRNTLDRLNALLTPQTARAKLTLVPPRCIDRD